jgi:uncharacterized protein YukE
MSKTIITDIETDANVKLIKVFRKINKEAGKAKKANQQHAYFQLCLQLQQLAERAESLGFHIWVNTNGKTGHTYEKDYKETPDELNDYNEYMNAMSAKLQQQARNMNLANQIMFGGNSSRLQAN